MSSTSDWMHFHQKQTSPSSSTLHVSSSPPAASSSDLIWAVPGQGQPTPTPAHGQLGPDGRVSKPARRRTRASRRTPTTLLNTDTSNFRAMVQQFTGGPAFASQPIGSGHFNVLGPHGLGLSGLGRSQNVAGPGSVFGLLGQPIQPAQYGVINNNNGNNNNNNGNNNNNNGSDLHGVGDLFMNSGGLNENVWK